MPRLLITLFAFFILHSQFFIASHCVAATTWQSIGPFGGTFNAIVIDPTNSQTVYAGADTGIFKSTNGGASWNAANTGLTQTDITSLAIDPNTPLTLYAGTWSGGAFKSSNGGTSWNAANTGLTSTAIYSLAIDPTTPQTLYAGTYSGIFKSTDGGGSWCAVNTGLTATNVQSIAIDPTSPWILYAGTNSDVFKSTNGGANWSAASTGLTHNSPDKNIYSLVITPTSPQTLHAGTENGVFVSTDGGGNWSAANIGLTATNGTQARYIFALAIDPISPQTIFAGTWIDGVFKSTNGGANWSAASTGLTEKENRSLAIDPTNPQTVYTVTKNLSVFKSTNGAASWNTANTGITAFTRALVIDPSPPQTLYAGTRSGIFKSTNGGASWSTANIGLIGTIANTEFTAMFINSLAINPISSQTLYAGTFNYGVFKSTNGGANWSAASTGMPKFTSIGTLVIDPNNHQTLYTGTSNGLFKSTNGGANWSAVNIDQPVTRSTLCLAIDPTTSQTVYAGTDRGIFKSINGGAIWSAAGGLLYPVVSLVIDPTSPQTIYAGTNSGVFKTTNGGAIWTSANYGLTITDDTYLTLDPANSQTLYAGTDSGIFKSSNGGATWTTANNGHTVKHINFLTLDPTNNQTIYAGTSEGVFVNLLSNNFPTMTGSSTATFGEGSPNAFHVTCSGWPDPQFSISGTLPSGITFDTATGTLSGTPASGSAGIYYLIFTATNGYPPDAVRGFTLIVLPSTTLSASISTPTTRAKPTSLTTITGTASGTDLTKVELQVTDGTYYLQTDGIFNTTPTWLTATGSSSWSLNTSTISWREGISYTISARAATSGTTSVPVTSTFTIQVPATKTGTILSLSLTPDTLRAGGSTTITGSLVKADTTAALGQTVTLLINPPSTAATPFPSPTVLNVTTDSSGNFTTGPLSLFSTPGVYLIQARYEGNSTLAASFSSQALGVTPHSGYAIIVSGKATDNSLLDMHNNTTDSIYATMLNKRGFLPENINYLKSTTSTAVTKQQIQDAVTTWAKGKLVSSPAPLFLIMIDHGTTEGFVIGDQTVTPDDLSGWLNTLEADPVVVSSGVLANYKRFVIIGSCYSGIFVPKLSKTGRVIITSAGADEQSLAGFNIYNSANNGANGTTLSGGEYFIDNMINFLGRGDSFKDAVTQSSSNVALRDPRKLEPGNHSGVYDTLAQHPLLDDTGSSNASYLPASSTNGTESANLTLGVGIKTPGNPADISAVTNTTIIPPTQSGDTPLWLSVSDNSRIAKAWMEIRTPITAVDSSGGSGQVIPRLIVKPLYYDGLQWNGSYTFPNAGTYKVLYYTQDNQTNDIAPAKNSTVYKQLSSNTAPPTFTLTSPSDQGAVNGIFPLTWQTVTSTNSITYTLHVATDQNFSNEIYKEENIPQATTYIPNAKLKNAAGQYYCQNDDNYCYWKVTAIDSFGATTESNTRSFTVISTNALPSLLKGTVTDSNGPVNAATISAGSYTIKTLPNGYYLLAVPSGSYTLSASANNQTQSKSITTTPGIVTSNDFVLYSTPTQYTVTPSATTGGTISPNTPQTLTSGATTTFTITPNTNYSESVSGCNGTPQAGNTPISYTTGAITSNCTVTATFTLTPPTPINGACGSANNTSVTSIPTTNLCTTGISSTVTGTGPWSWSCTGINNGTSANCSASVKTPEVKVFQSSSTPEAFTVATSGTKLYGGTGRDVISINSGVNNVTLDQNVDRVNLFGTTGSYRFKQSGNLLKIYDENGTTLIVTIPVQGDNDGTQIGFTNGTATLVYDAKLVLGQLTVGGYTVPPNTPAIIYPSNQRADDPVPSTTSTAGIYLSNNDVTVSNSGARVFGSGSDALTITTGTNNITFDQNISQLKFTEMSSNYRLQQTGNMINVYAADGTTLIARGPVQASPGTKITFLDGSGYVSISGGGMKLNSAVISAATPTAIGVGVLTP